MAVTIFLSSAPFHIPKLFLHIFAIYENTRLIISDYTLASTLTSSLLLATTSSLQRVGDCPERQVITIFYSNAGLPTLYRDNRIISRNVTLINTLHHSLQTLLYTNPLSLILGHWFSRRWVNARAAEWFSPTVEAAFQATLSATQMLRRTKETSQYGRSTSNYGTCKECLMRYMIIRHMSPYDTYGSM